MNSTLLIPIACTLLRSLFIAAGMNAAQASDESGKHAGALVAVLAAAWGVWDKWRAHQKQPPNPIAPEKPSV